MLKRTQAGWTAAILVIGVLGFAPRAKAVNKTVLSTGPEGGVYAPVGKAIGEILDAAAEGEVFETRVVTSPGSVANLRRLSQGDAAMAIVQGDVLFHAVRGSNAFPEPLTGVRAIAVLFPEAVHLIARRDAGIEKLEDLLGKRVGLGATGSGTELTTQSILEAAGLSKEQLEPFRGSSSEALDALAAGTLDAAFVVSAIGAKRLVDRFQASELRLVSLGEKVVTRLAEATPYLSPSSIAQGIYRDRSDAATITASMDAIFVTTDEAPPELVHEALEQLDRNLEVLRATLPPGIPVMPERNVQSLPVPLHLGSMSYYQSRGVFERPIRVLTGLYIRDLWDFDIKHGFDVDFEVWFKWKGRLDAANDHLDFELA
ncbi:MAG: TAXI family TRAP transporter solute-binding subunit, partial [Planctomycetota bacterium]